MSSSWLQVVRSTKKAKPSNAEYVMDARNNDSIEGKTILDVWYLVDS
jgi:hypothetical protein